jgi:hypothetical protein
MSNNVFRHACGIRSLYCEVNVAVQACIIVGVPVISIWMAVAPIMFWSKECILSALVFIDDRDRSVGSEASSSVQFNVSEGKRLLHMDKTVGCQSSNMIEDFGSYSSTATVRETGQLSDDEHAEGQVSSCAYITRR